MRNSAFALLFLTLAVGASGQSIDAERQLRKLNDWYASTVKARVRGAEGSAIPYGDVVRSVQDERKTRALAIVERIKPEAFRPASSLAAAELYCDAGLIDNKVAAARRFLTSNPSPKRRFQAHEFLLEGYESLSDANGLNAVLREIKPPTKHDALLIMNQATGFVRSTIAPKLGGSAALDALRRTEALASLTTLMKDPREKELADNVLANVASARAHLLSDMGRREEARHTLTDARRRVKLPTDILMLDRAAKELKIPLGPPPSGKKAR